MSVGRATISHILSGRNKPSLDFVMKITSSFPEVDLYWLLYGRGVFPKVEEKPKADLKAAPSFSVASKPQEQNQIKEIQTPPAESKSNTAVFENSSKATSNTQKIKRVLIFFEDGQFESYEP
jgi:hypothetical protein